MVKKKNETLEWMKAMVIAVVIVFTVRAFLFTPIVVDSASMNTTHKITKE